LRRRSADGDDALAELADPGLDPAEQVLIDERDRTLLRHLAQLSARCRQLLRVVAMVDRPDYDTVAQAMQMPRGSVGPTRGRCLAKLRDMLLADPTWSQR
jgi:DNA-directed RNA polymerase specialized sigma24 family protein